MKTREVLGKGIKLTAKLGLVGLIGLVVVLFLTRPSGRIIAQWTQPATINYASYDPYTLSVVEHGIDLHTIPWKRTHLLFVGRGTAIEYGHYVRISFPVRSAEMETHIKASKVEWTAEGVQLEPPSGHRIFVPKKMFIGGR